MTENVINSADNGKTFYKVQQIFIIKSPEETRHKKKNTLYFVDSTIVIMIGIASNIRLLRDL